MMNRVLGVIVVTAFSSCFPTLAERAQVQNYRVSTPAVLTSDPFVLEIGSVHSGAFAKNILVEVVLRNPSDKEAQFDSSELELLDVARGISYYSFSKDRTVIGEAATDGISKVHLPPKRAIEGHLLFVTPPGKAIGDSYELRLGEAKVLLEHMR